MTQRTLFTFLEHIHLENINSTRKLWITKLWNNLLYTYYNFEIYNFLLYTVQYFVLLSYFLCPQFVQRDKRDALVIEFPSWPIHCMDKLILFPYQALRGKNCLASCVLDNIPVTMPPNVIFRNKRLKYSVLNFVYVNINLFLNVC